MVRVLLVKLRANSLQQFVNWLTTSKKEVKVDERVYQCSFLTQGIDSKIKLIACMIINFTRFIRELPVLGKKYGSYDAVILNGHLVAIPYLLAIKLCAFFCRKQKIIVLHFFLHGLGERKIIKKMLAFILNNDAYRLIVQSVYEEKFYNSFLRRAHIDFFPYCQGDIKFKDILQPTQSYIFSGGYTNRDYASLVNAAEKIQAPFVIIKSRLNQALGKIPNNVDVLEDVGHDIFYSYVKHASIVIIPLKNKTGSSGQMLALAAMFMKKPVIYPADSTVSHYFVDGVSGIAYEMGNVADLRSKITQLVSNNELCFRLGQCAYKTYREKYHNVRYFEYLSQILNIHSTSNQITKAGGDDVRDSEGDKQR